jgi:hypothetical protein
MADTEFASSRNVESERFVARKDRAFLRRLNVAFVIVVAGPTGVRASGILAASAPFSELAVSNGD